MTKATLSPFNDSGFIATLHEDPEPVRNKDKLPIVFDTLKAGKAYLKKRFKDNWTNYYFRMARYHLPENTEIVLM